MARNTVDFWNEKATKELVGKRIVKARYLSKGEMQALGWTKSVLVLTLDDGTLLFPSRDDEGNDGGALFGQGPNNEEVCYPVIGEYLMDREPWSPPTSKPDPIRGYMPRYDGDMEQRHKNMLKRVRKGDVLHARCWETLSELNDMGYLSSMTKTVEGCWKVELSEKAA